MIAEKYATLPAINEGEVTLIGAGGYGESIVCHLGDNNWIVIDSCINPDNNEDPLPLKYLNEIGVSPLNIKLIICSHWHDDHIRGLSKILEAATNADFCISRAHDKSKFLRFVGMDSGKPLNFSTKEFTNCLSILKARGKHFIDALEDRPIFKSANSSLICLSPSDYTTQKFDAEIAELLAVYQTPTKRIPYSTPNAKSIVLYAKLGCKRAIFGADLELEKHADEGWLKVISNQISIDKKASLFKISHHGSVTGYHSDIWDILLEENSVAKLTPWKLGGKSLPKDEMLDTYLSHTNQLYMTLLSESNKQKVRDGQIEKLIKQFRPNLQEIKYRLGIVRSRINIQDEESVWSTEAILGAKKV